MFEFMICINVQFLYFKIFFGHILGLEKLENETLRARFEILD